jgi:nucleoid-associated protein YgaU
MGCVQQAVLEFDEEVQAPWRPRLVSGPDLDGGMSARPPISQPSRRSPSRVGVCRPSAPQARPATGERDGRAARSSGAPVVRTVPRRPSPAGRRPVSARRPPSHPAARAGLRLTRRARRLAVVLALAAGVAVGSWLDPLLGAGGGELRLAGESSVVVQPGDTLWSIAASLDGGGDVRALIDEIQELNGLRDAGIRPGQTLLLP